MNSRLKRKNASKSLAQLQGADFDMGIKVVRGSDTPTSKQLSGHLRNCYSIVTIGKFDGMHLGHLELFAATKRIACENANSASVLMTFAPHPDDYFSQLKLGFATRRHEGMLMPVREKIRFSERQGLNYFYIAKFDQRFINLSCEDFFNSYLISTLCARHVVVGYDWSFGKSRAGNVDTLKELADKHGVLVEVVPPVSVRDVRVSSKRIKVLIKTGLVQEAAELLGRPYALIGCVKPGAQRGRDLGYPTANLSDLKQRVPGHGVYACVLEVEGKRFDSVVNVGTRPTFDNGHVTVEAHVLDRLEFELYGKRLRIFFIRKLRDEKRFESPAALSLAISKDVDEARATLAPLDRELL